MRRKLLGNYVACIKRRQHVLPHKSFLLHRVLLEYAGKITRSIGHWLNWSLAFGGPLVTYQY